MLACREEKKAMYDATNPEGIQVPTAVATLSGEKRENMLKRHRVMAIF